MARNIQNKWVDKRINNLLNLLINKQTSTEEYANAMYELGDSFGHIIQDSFNFNDKKVAIACTVEDADYLAKGIIDVIEKSSKKIFLAVFWNKRFKPNQENNISVAPIIKEFHEPEFQTAEILIVLKSIISNSCVIRTNLTRLIEELSPKEILIVAPVLLQGAQSKLESEFDEKISSKFQYLFFAEDTDKTDDGLVIPGIGGDVYQRLGFESGQDAKNRFVPNIVKQRRLAFA